MILLNNFPETNRITINFVNRTLHDLGYKEKLVKGNVYFYFIHYSLYEKDYDE